jgi:hypothetical protein
MPPRKGIGFGTVFAAVDSKRQVIVAAEAFGEGQEQRLFTTMVEAIPASWRTGARFTADAPWSRCSATSTRRSGTLDEF